MQPELQPLHLGATAGEYDVRVCFCVPVLSGPYEEPNVEAQNKRRKPDDPIYGHTRLLDGGPIALADETWRFEELTPSHDFGIIDEVEKSNREIQ